MKGTLIMTQVKMIKMRRTICEEIYVSRLVNKTQMCTVCLPRYSVIGIVTILEGHYGYN